MSVRMEVWGQKKFPLMPHHQPPTPARSQCLQKSANRTKSFLPETCTYKTYTNPGQNRYLVPDSKVTTGLRTHLLGPQTQAIPALTQFSSETSWNYSETREQLIPKWTCLWLLSSAQLDLLQQLRHPPESWLCTPVLHLSNYLSPPLPPSPLSAVVYYVKNNFPSSCDERYFMTFNFLYGVWAALTGHPVMRFVAWSWLRRFLCPINGIR